MRKSPASPPLNERRETQMFVTYKMENRSTRKDHINNIEIIISEALGDDQVGSARMVSFNDIYVKAEDIEGRFKLKKRAVKELERNFIFTLDDLFSKAWLVSNGGWIMHQLERIK